MHDTSPQHLNPWFSIWTNPRNTIQQIVNEDPKHMVLLLAISPTLIQWFGFVIISMLNGMPLAIVPLAINLVVGLISSIAFLYLNSAVTRWTGTWFGGEGSAVNIRAAMAWSTVPAIFIFSFMLLGVALFGLLGLTGYETAGVIKNLLDFIKTVLAVLLVATVLWSIIIYLDMLSHVQGFSMWKALGNMLVSGLILGLLTAVVLFALVMVLFGIIGFKM
jgi:hypothetical protein